MSIPSQKIEAAIAHLRDADPIMDKLIEQVGPFRLKLERRRFAMLVRSIISQQISTKAARSIRLRLEEKFHPEPITPEAVLACPFEELRELGLSGQKANYLLDLSRKVMDGTVALRTIGRLSDEEVIRQLIQVKGIGRWTAQMFLMFSLGRLDVFPHDDLGIRSALRNLYGLDGLPDKVTSQKIAEPWKPYATIACWYCWRSGERTQQQTNDQPADYPV